MNGRGILRIADLIGDASGQHGTPDGKWYRAVPYPIGGQGWRAAWAVLRGRAHAIEWPKPGDLERAVQHDLRPTTPGSADR